MAERRLYCVFRHGEEPAASSPDSGLKQSSLSEGTVSVRVIHHLEQVLEVLAQTVGRRKQVA
jgi:hypothetical protein